MKDKFNNLPRNIQALKTTTPIFVSLVQDPDAETKEQFAIRQKKFVALKTGIKYKLSRIDISQKIQAIGQKYGFELLHLANITRLIREYYFGEARLENFPTEIERRMSVSLLTAQEIARYLKQEIIDWDPWAQYLAKLPKISVREMVEKKLKIADTEITAGYIELRDPARNASHSDAGGSDDLEDPTIKNWIHDFITHLGYGQHSQMQRTEYLFHSENGRDLSSQDREKLSIILRSFDENIPLPVDEENGEIVFDGIAEKNPPPAPPFSKGERPTQSFPLSQRGTKGDFEKASAPNNFIKPYNPTSPQPLPARPASTQNFAKPNPASSAGKPASQPQSPTQVPPVAKIPYRVTTSDPNIDKYFNAPETPDIPSIKIHSMTEHNEPPVRNPARRDSDAGRKPAPLAPPRPIVQRPAPPQPERPKYRVINPFEPRIDGNIVDLSNNIEE